MSASSASQMSGATANTTDSPSKYTGDVSEVVAAIQRVLTEHNISDARFTLELPESDAAPSAIASVASRDGAASEAHRAGSKSAVPASVDISASNAGGRSSNAALLMGVRATPPAASLSSPKPQLPVPRALSPSVRNKSPVSQRPPSFLQRDVPVFPSQRSGSPPLNGTVEMLDCTARPSTEKASDSQCLQQAESVTTAQKKASPTITFTEPSTRLREPSPRGLDGSITSADLTDGLVGEDAARVRHASERLAREIAVADAQAMRKEILQSFIGRSAILDYSRQREANHKAQPSIPSSKNGSHPTVPLKAPAASPTTATSISSPRRGAAGTPLQRSPAGTISSDATGSAPTAPAAPSSALQSPSFPEPQPPQRRSVVRLTTPAPSTSANSCGTGSRGAAVSDSSSLPSLVSAKRSAVPGKTPVFSILNKDGSRLLDQGGAAATPWTPTAAPPSTGVTSAATTGTTTNGNAVTEAHQVSSDSNSNSISYSRQSRPSSVSLLKDDRAPPSPVYEPLLGTAAKEEASRQRSILVPNKLRVSTPEAQPLESCGSRDVTEILPKLWTEQSKDNARIAAQLQSQSRLSCTTDGLDPPQRPVTAGPHLTGNPDASTAKAPSLESTRRFSPVSSTASAAAAATAASSRPSLREMLQEQQHLQEFSRRGMEGHNQLMQSLVSTPNLGISSSLPSKRFTPSKKPAASTTATEAVPRPAPGPATSARGSSPGHNTSFSSTSSTSCIQVVKFTLPNEEEARQAAVQQLCHSTAGTQHLDNKARYRALLDEQRSEFTAQEGKSQAYKELLSRAVDYNTKRS